MTVQLSTADHVHFIHAVEAVDPTCTEPGMQAHFACTYCGAVFEDEDGNSPADVETLTIPAREHSFTSYAYNNDATCTADGTETAYCDYNCGESDTRTAEGTKLPHSYGDPVWNWSDDHSSATAIFTCACGDKQTVTAAAPAKTEVSAATATADQVVTYTASVTFDGKTYTQTTPPVSVPGTATGTPDEPQSGNLCPWDETDHGASFGGRLLRFFHSILYFFAHLFGVK